MRWLSFSILLVTLLALLGCGGMAKTVFVHSEYDFGYIERVAVASFENISNDQGAGFRARRYFTTSLLATEAFDIVEPGEVTRALSDLGLARVKELNTDQIISLGKEIGAQGIFIGAVSESGVFRRGAANVNVVTIVLRLVETETGSTVWTVTNTYDSSNFWSALFGSSQKPLSEVTRKCIDGCLSTLIN